MLYMQSLMHGCHVGELAQNRANQHFVFGMERLTRDGWGFVLGEQRSEYRPGAVFLFCSLGRLAS